MLVKFDYSFQSFFKWMVCSITLLAYPQSVVAIVPVFIVLCFFNYLRLDDLVLLFFLIFVLIDVLFTAGSLANIRYFLIPGVVVKYLLGKICKYDYLNRIGILFFLLFIYLLFNSLKVSVLSNHSLTSFAVFVCMIVFCFIGSRATDYENFNNKVKNLQSFWITIFFLSVLALPIVTIGFARNGVGFQGVTNHPNLYGAFFAPFCGYLVVKMLRNFSFLTLLLFLAALSLLFMSESRTSILSFILGILIYSIMSKEIRHFIKVNIKKSSFFVILIVLLSFTVFKPYLNSFLLKRDINENVVEAVEQSRGKLILAQLENIQNNPLWGIGFKVPSSKELVNLKDSDSLHYEKGNMILGIWEELGLVGLISFSIILVAIVLNKSNYNLYFRIVPIVFFFTTLGEATLFSIGGLGIIIWYSFFLNNQFSNQFSNQFK